ncbi:MAG: DUF3048 domain-containing protein [Actinomycetia bacterium]|nr:DUF3048 domain-containing protein [Actinomycetes bacterium]
MISKKIRGLKIISLATAAIMFCSIIIFSLAGCKTGGASAEEGAVAEESQQIETVKEEEENVTEPSEAVEEKEKTEEETGSTANLEITGDINLLSGLELSDTVQNGRPVAVMVENSPAARFQSGLINADIVFEVVDEYGITRYIAIFSSNEAEIMGPVRSTRIYYAEIARSFDPVYVFWGTYPDAYPVIKNMDMDLLDANSDAHVPYTDAGWRDYSRSEISWSSAFIDTLGIKEDAVKHGYSLEGGQSPMKFKLDADDSERGSITDIAINISLAEYLTDFKYDKIENKYFKSVAGAPHLDFDSGEQLNCNNVIVLVTAIDGPIDEFGHMVVRTMGAHEAGAAYYFMDGNVIEGTWGRNSIFDPFEFRNIDGDPVLFNRGSTWISMIPNIDRLIY